MEGKSTVSLCMIVKNEEKYLRKCLESVKDIVDEMIIVDTGSTDRTIDIAKEFDAKIIFYKWKNDFSAARNVSLSYAKMDWILIMDGDDIFSIEEHERFRNIVNNDKSDYDIVFFNTASFSGDANNYEILNNMNVRLIRNNKKYKFVGAIHEQISTVEGEITTNRRVYSNINIYHYGYISEVALGKNKRDRNISILEKELKENPENMFNVFNLGNEYFALGDKKKSLELYDKVYKKIDESVGYFSKLVMRRILCFRLLGDKKAAIKAIDDAYKILPEFTDLPYQKAIICKQQGKYTVAIELLEECIKKGESPMNLGYLAGSGSFKAYELLGDIYLEVCDYDKALKSYEEAYKLRKDRKQYLFSIINALIKKKREYEDLDIAQYINEIEKENKEDIKENKEDILDVLLSNGFLDDFDKLLETLNKKDIKNNRYLFLKARRIFYDKKYLESLGYFSYLEEQNYNIYEVVKYKTLIFLNISSDVVLNYINKAKIDEIEKEVLIYCYKLINNIEVGDFSSKYDTKKLLNLAKGIVREELLIKELDLFEKLLGLFNYIIDDEVLLPLIKLYDELGYEKMASREVVRSIKMFNVIDPSCIGILRRGI